MNTDDNLTEETEADDDSTDEWVVEENRRKELHTQARREFVDQAALLAMQEIVRARHFHPTEPLMIATRAYDLAIEMAKQREQAHIELMCSIY